jgi:polar amino acid transport system permease protein
MLARFYRLFWVKAKNVKLLESMIQDRFRTPSIPKSAMPISLAALLVSSLTTLYAWWVVWQLGLALSGVTEEMVTKSLAQQTYFADTLKSVSSLPLLAWLVLLLLALLPLLLFVPTVRSIRHAQQASRALTREDLIAARVQTADSSDAGWYAIGYAIFALLVFTAIWFVVARDVAVGNTFFKLDLMLEKAGLVGQAFLTNVFIFMVAQVFILIWGLVVAIARMVPGKAGQPIRLLATLYTDAFRGLPSVITIYLIGFGLPLTGFPILGDLPPVWYAIFALTLTYGAYVAEVYRAGIESIHPSQMMAARSLGLNFVQTMRFVIVPQAIRRIIPPLLNDFIGLQKDTALVNVIGTIDAFNQARILASNNFNLSTVTIVAILFVLITIPQARFVDRLLEQDAKKTRGAK